MVAPITTGQTKPKRSPRKPKTKDAAPAEKATAMPAETTVTLDLFANQTPTVDQAPSSAPTGTTPQQELASRDTDAAPLETPATVTATERATIVFDFDGTLVRGDCGHRYLHWLLRRNPLRLLAAAIVAPVAFPLLSIPATRRHAVSLFLWLATLGLGDEKLASLAARFIAGYPLRPIRSAVEALQEEVSRGHRVVVATGALRVLAEGLLQRMAIRETVELVASDSRRFAGGCIVRWQCNGETKLRRLRAEGFPAPYLRAYSDHHSDRWLLAAAGTPVLVNASPRDRRRLRAQFGQKLRIVLWQ